MDGWQPKFASQLLIAAATCRREKPVVAGVSDLVLAGFCWIVDGPATFAFAIARHQPDAWRVGGGNQRSAARLGCCFPTAPKKRFAATIVS